MIHLGRDRVLALDHATVVEVLERGEDFGVEPIYGAKMRAVSGDFFLGMDHGPRYRRESGFVRGAMRPEDLPRIGELVGRFAADAVSRGGATVDIVGDVFRPATLHLIEAFFGVRPDQQGQLATWLDDAFHHLFLNLGDDASVRRAGESAGGALREHLFACLDERKAAGASADTLLDRLILLQRSASEPLDDDGIVRNIAGVVIGALATTVKAATQALGVLVERPETLRAARRLAERGRLPTEYVFEALRFDPFNPVILRAARRDTTLGRARRPVRKGATVYATTLAAMFDPAAFPDPWTFRDDRPLASYLLFGHGLHHCFGAQINAVTLPALLLPIVARQGVERARPLEIVWDGTGLFPARWVVETGPSSAT